MKVIFGIRHLFAVLGLGTVLLGTSGCDGDHSNVTIEPDGSAKVEPRYTPPNHPVDDLKKDVKPPVVVKPTAPAGDATTPVSPKRESR
jgi:hypothetical protein